MKIFKLILSIFFGIVISSCQHDDDTITKITAQSLTKVSPVTSLLSRVSQNPTAIDNILDGTSFCSVKLPVTLYVDYQKVIVNSKADYALVADIMKESAFDDDKVNFVYPVNMLLRNFNQLQVNSEYQLNELKESYGEYDDFDEIDCIDINFPISINVYDSNNQIANSLTFQTNPQLFNFLDNLKDTDVYAFVFPFTMTSSVNGQTITINNNIELSSAIESVIGLCDTPVGNHTNVLSTTIVNGTWRVSYFLDDNVDEAYKYSGYNFLFSSNGSVIATKNNTSIAGTWNTYTDDGIDKIRISFTNDVLHELDKDWSLLEFNTSNIRLYHGNSDSHYLYLTKN